jgi:hypothetical protein
VRNAANSLCNAADAGRNTRLAMERKAGRNHPVLFAADALPQN